MGVREDAVIVTEPPDRIALGREEVSGMRRKRGN